MYVWAALTFFFLSTRLGPWVLPIFSSGYIQQLFNLQWAILRLAYVFYRPQSCNLVPCLPHRNPAAELTRPLGTVGIRAGATDVVWLFWDLRLHQDTYFMNSKTSTRQSWHANEILQTRLWISDVSYLRTAGIPAEATEANCTVDYFDNAGGRISRPGSAENTLSDLSGTREDVWYGTVETDWLLYNFTCIQPTMVGDVQQAQFRWLDTRGGPNWQCPGGTVSCLHASSMLNNARINPIQGEDGGRRIPWKLTALRMLLCTRLVFRMVCICKWTLFCQFNPRFIRREV